MDQAKLTSKAASAVASSARSIVRSVALSSLAMRKQLWVWPILAVILLSIVGWWVSRSVETAMRERRIADMQTILQADVAAVKVWIAEQAVDAELIAGDEKLAEIVAPLLKIADGDGNLGRQLMLAPEQDALRQRLTARLKHYGYTGYFVVSPDCLVVAADIDNPLGTPLGGYRKEYFDRVNAGKTEVSKPYSSTILLPDEHGELRAGLPTMFTASPLRNEEGEIVGALGLRIRPDKDFTRILQIAKSGKTGETYAFDQSGRMLSQSRFDEQLKEIGLLVDQTDAHSILAIELRNPGANMMLGERPTERRAKQPLTKLAGEATAGRDGHDVNGYRDYRGVPSIGAWMWLDDLGFGVATEQDKDEAFQALYVLRKAFWGMFALLIASSVAIFVFSVFVARANRAARIAAIEAKRLGQYTLDEKLGEGGMGMVYRAHHAMLHRPTAVKLLSVEKTNTQSLARFEREVQLTSRLNHPNTIAIYDYGHTPEGIFYYAMEYLQGINLEDLIKQYGPQSEGRVIYILDQICGSLAEAHSIELIHRDIKPANIMLTDRGGLHDFVKVLDFGLAKALDAKKSSSVTSAGTFTGTPLYMSPESIQHPEHVDARGDLYAVGAVGYFLLTGTPVFDGESVISILQKHVSATPDSLSTRLGAPVSADLEQVILRCLSKNVAERPQTATELADDLTRCRAASSWNRKEADRWWRQVTTSGGVATTKPETSDHRFATTQAVGNDKEPSATQMFDAPQ
ncbi:MAG TPA: serine/threonine protein kinase [Pirellulales bacterium]